MVEQPKKIWEAQEKKTKRFYKLGNSPYYSPNIYILMVQILLINIKIRY